MIKNHLRNCSSSKKCTIYLKLAALSNQLPIDLIIKKAVRFNLSSKLIAETLEKQENYKKQRLIISAELLKLIIEEAYSIKKKAAAVAADLAEPLALVPLKNLLLKRNELRLSSEAQYFLLDLLASFGSEAADLAELLKNIISKSSDPWLKYHALKAYTQIAVKNESYQEFIAEMKAKEKEPVTLALE